MKNRPTLKEKFFSLKTIISFAIAFGVIYFMVTRTEPAKIWNAFLTANYYWYLAAIAVYYMAFPLRSLRFRIMLRNNEISSEVGVLNRILLISWFANCIVPAKMGDLYRGYLVRDKYGLPFMKTLGVIFVERVFDLLILYIIIGVTGLISFDGRVPDNIMYLMKTGFFIVLGLFAISLTVKGYGHRAMKWIPQGLKEFVSRFLSGTAASMRDYSKITLLTAGIWFMEGLSFYFVIRAMHISLPIATVLFIALASALMTALPVTPAGLGFVEMAKVGVMVLFGLPHDIALSTALLDRFINYWSLLLVGLFLYMSANVNIQGGGVTCEGNDCDTNLQ